MKDIVLLHGALADRAQLEPLKAALEPRVRCHLLEFEGHGATASAHDYDISRFAENVLAFMKEQRLKRASVFGYSMGGYVALSLAAALPGLFDSVATLGTKLAWTPEAAATETRRLDPGVIRAKVPAFAAALEKRHAGAGGWELVLARTAALMTGLGRQPVVDDRTLAAIGVPVRLMVGNRDAVVSIAETERAAQALAKGELVVLPDTVHPFEQVRVPLVAAQLLDFFA